MKSVMHEIHDHLAVAVANVEAFCDGELEPSPARLTAVLHALHEVEVRLHDVRRPPGVRALAKERKRV